MNLGPNGILFEFSIYLCFFDWLSFIKGMTFLDKLSICYLLKEDCAPWS
jgi:hypothetical protein